MSGTTRGFTGISAEPGSVISGMTGAYVLADDAGGTEVTCGLQRGPPVPLLGVLERESEKVIIDTALKGLKARVEGLRAQAAAAGGTRQDQDRSGHDVTERQPGQRPDRRTRRWLTSARERAA